MCVHDTDGMRGWTSDCPDSAWCWCNIPGVQQPNRRTTTSVAPRQSIGRTIFHVMLGIGALLLALIVGVIWICSPEDERRPHRYS
jgi:hypothetical protein